MQCRLCPSTHLTPVDRDVLDYEYRSPGSYSYWRCEACGLLNIDPIPDEAALDKAYPPTYHAYLPQPNALARYLKRRYWRKKARRCARYVGREAAVLDAGCGSGDFLIEMRELGFSNLRGVDFNPHVVRRARQQDLEVYEGELTAAPIPPESLDLIVMTNFIEHVYDPLETLRSCRELLAPGGFIVGETPNVDSWDYSVFRRQWGGYHTPRHLYLFNTDNLKLLATEAGFAVERIDNMLQPAHWALSVQNRLQNARWSPTIRNGRSRLFTPLLLMSLPINTAQMVFSKTSLVEFVMRKA